MVRTKKWSVRQISLCAPVVLFTLAPALAGCERATKAEQTPQEPGGNRQAAQLSTNNPSPVLNATDAVGANLGRYRAFWPKRTDDELATYVASVGKLLRSSPIKLVQTAGLRNAVVTPFDDANINVSYRSQFDDLRIYDVTRLPEARPTTDIGEKAAGQVAKNVVKTLAANGTVRAEHYDTNEMATGHHQREDYAGDGQPTVTYTVEYRFRLLRKLNGIEAANNGIVVGITPDGQLSSLRLGGVQFDTEGTGGDSEAPTSTGSVVQRKVSTDAVAERFTKEAGTLGSGKYVLWSKKMYVMPTDEAEAILEPKLVYRFTSIVASNGANIPSPAKVLAYSLTDPAAAPVAFTAE